MLRENTKILKRIQRTSDALVTGLCFAAAYFVKRDLLPFGYAGLTTSVNYYTVLLSVIIIWYLCLNGFDIYRPFREHSLSWFFITIVKATLTGFVFLSLILFIFHMKEVSRLFLGIFCILNVACLFLMRVCIVFILQKIRTKGFNTRNVLIIGSKLQAESVIKSIDENKAGGYKILGCFDPEKEKVGKSVGNGYIVLGTMEQLLSYLKDNVVDELIFAMPLGKIDFVGKHMAEAESMGVRIRIIPDWQLQDLAYKPNIAHLKIAQFSGIHTLTLQSTPSNEELLMIKTILDYAFAVFFILIGLPIFLAISIAIFFSSPGPVFYKQVRLGQNGRKFNLIKFRTMVPDADQKINELKALNEADGPVFKIKNDPRIIPGIGVFLRKTSLDELPQLFNVVMGDMSLVGPRPPIPTEVNDYDLWQRRRLSMKPGLTCLWQIAPHRNELSFDEWMKLDMEYIDKWSLKLDFVLLFRTAGAVLTGAGR